jgi:hypothetical protein
MCSDALNLLPRAGPVVHRESDAQEIERVDRLRKSSLVLCARADLPGGVKDGDRMAYALMGLGWQLRFEERTKSNEGMPVDTGTPRHIQTL